jgi:hypothetical protein
MASERVVLEAKAGPSADAKVWRRLYAIGATAHAVYLSNAVPVKPGETTEGGHVTAKALERLFEERLAEVWRIAHAHAPHEGADSMTLLFAELDAWGQNKTLRTQEAKESWERRSLALLRLSCVAGQLAQITHNASLLP